MIDLAHITEQGFWDVARESTQPLVATHSNAHALTPISRNLTDRQLDAIRERKGIAGLNYATSHYDRVERRDDSISGTLNAEYKLNRTLSTRFAYTYTRGLSNVIGEGYTSSVWLLGLKASL